jgi:hypothetical protein
MLSRSIARSVGGSNPPRCSASCASASSSSRESASSSGSGWVPAVASRRSPPFLTPRAQPGARGTRATLETRALVRAPPRGRTLGRQALPALPAIPDRRRVARWRQVRREPARRAIRDLATAAPATRAPPGTAEQVLVQPEQAERVPVQPEQEATPRPRPMRVRARAAPARRRGRPERLRAVVAQPARGTERRAPGWRGARRRLTTPRRAPLDPPDRIVEVACREVVTGLRRQALSPNATFRAARDGPP